MASADVQPRALRHRPAIALFVVAAAALLTVDLVVKSLAFERVAGTPVVLDGLGGSGRDAIPPHDSRILVPKILALHLTVNEGAVFGLGQGGRWAFIAFSVVASCVIVVVFLRSDPRARVLHLALAAVLAGALGNLSDRIAFGLVRDMLLLFPGVRLPFGLHWPDGSAGLYPWIFNIADVCLIVGLVVLMILMYRHDKAAAKAKKVSGAA